MERLGTLKDLRRLQLSFLRPEPPGDLHEAKESPSCDHFSSDGTEYPSPELIEADVDFMCWSAQLSNVIRYVGQYYWKHETAEHLKARELECVHRNGETVPRMESVAEHSWHLADMALLLSPRYPFLNRSRCLEIAILHDKLEIITGDADPVGDDGTGGNGSAFNASKQSLKASAERTALKYYLNQVEGRVRTFQQRVLIDTLSVGSEEARFIKGLDKLQPMVFILLKKLGDMSDNHLEFTFKYSRTSITYFPLLRAYYCALTERLIHRVAAFRGIQPSILRSIAQPYLAFETT